MQIALAVLSLLGIPLAACTSAAGEPRNEARVVGEPRSEAPAVGEPRDEAPVVVELFTSQGCSSCPAAECLVNQLAREGQLGGRAVVPLAFHVDYWDGLGWADPFALPAWSERQRDYADALGDSSVYTPELVVAGRDGMVGSNALAAARAVAAAPRQQRIDARATWAKDKVTVEAKAPAGADVFVAIWQDGTRTHVPRGENAGATLASDHVVRRLERVAVAGTSGQTTIAIPRWGTVGGVVFAQRPDRTIVGATVLPR
jgi:hypothetical protein